MPPILLDHVFVAYLALVYPFVAWRNFPALVERIRAGGEPLRVRAYQATVLTWLLHLALLLGLWLFTRREWEALGLRGAAPGDTLAGLVLGGLLLGAFAAYAWRQRAVRATRSELEQSSGPVAVFLPRTAREERWFRIMSLNAGVTEELLFRAYLYWYLLHWLGPGLAAAGTVLAFTAGHLYQGLRQLPGIALMGTFFIVLYLVSDSILLPIVVHALVDVVQGRMLAGLLRRGQP